MKFTCSKCQYDYCHSIIATDKGLRMVTRKQHLRWHGIPALDNLPAVADLFENSDAKITWAEEAQREAA